MAPPLVVQSQIADRTLGSSDLLLNAATTAQVGPWVALNRVRPFTVTIRESTGGGTFTVRLRVANGKVSPAVGDNKYPQIGQDYTAMAAPEFTEASYDWICAELVSPGGGATLTVALAAG